MSKPTKPLKEIGAEAIQWELYNEGFNVCFKFYDDFITEGKVFSEITLLEFVAKSYAESCLTLINKILDYTIQDSNSSIRYKAYRFLPAMFCFRHSIELRLKCLYMLLKRESFKNEHKLSNFLKILKDSGLKTTVFDKPIEFLSTCEKNDGHFRYFIDTSFNCTNKIEIKKDDLKKVIEYIKAIETEYPELKIRIREQQITNSSSGTNL